MKNTRDRKITPLDQNPEGLPLPRLQLRWEKADPDADNWYASVCVYELVMPLNPLDIRAEGPEGQLSQRSVLRLEIARTNVTGGNGTPPIHNGTVSTPYRDGRHAEWDAELLKLPAWATCCDQATKVYPTAKPENCQPSAATPIITPMNPACPACRVPLVYYDGALGYESFVCPQCRWDIKDRLTVAVAAQLLDATLAAEKWLRPYPASNSPHDASLRAVMDKLRAAITSAGGKVEP